jgi:hypothetical protein
MFDELERLGDVPDLLKLLTHYAQVGAAERETWQDRLLALEDVPTGELVKLHGELLAYSWIEQNTGSTPILKPGAVACCYRITVAGQRALKWALTERIANDDNEAAAA